MIWLWCGTSIGRYFVHALKNGMFQRQLWQLCRICYGRIFPNLVLGKHNSIRFMSKSVIHMRIRRVQKASSVEKRWMGPNLNARRRLFDARTPKNGPNVG